MDAARQDFGLRIPEDLCIIGFDDIEQAGWGADNFTSFAQPIAATAAAAVAALADDGANAPAEMRMVPPLLWRGTVQHRNGGAILGQSGRRLAQLPGKAWCRRGIGPTLQRLPTIDEPIDPGDVPCIVAEQEGHSGGNILGLADAAQGNPVGKPPHAIDMSLPVTGGNPQTGFDDAGADGVDPNAILGAVMRGAPGQADNGVLGGDIGCCAGQHIPAGHGGAHIDHGAALSGFDHDFDRRAEHQKGPAQIDPHDPVPFRRRQLEEGGGGAGKCRHC